MGDLTISAELREGLNTLSTQIDAKLNEQNKNNGKANESVRADIDKMAKDFVQMQNELNDSMTALEQKSVGVAGAGAGIETVGKTFVNSDAFSKFKAKDVTKASHTFQNNTITTGGDNSVTRHEQLPGVVPGAFTDLEVLPTVSRGQTGSNIVYYSRELAWTNAAAGTAEGAQKPESTLTFEEVQEPVITIPHTLKVSKQALNDSTFLASYIDMRMLHGVRDEIENQIINGTGAGDLSGWLNTGNHVVTSPLLTVDFFGLARKMKQEIKSAKYSASYFYVNPIDWAAAEVLRRGTGDAAFLAASGAVSYVNNGLTPLLWGLPVVESTNVPAGTIICKSTMADMYLDREEVTVEMFEQDGDNVQKNLLTIRAEARGAEAVMVPAAIRTGAISGITSA
jgi:HK97 family phage major capsid protein